QEWSVIKYSLAVIFFLSICGQVLFPLNLYIALQYTSPLNAAIYLSATPALVLLVNKIIFKDDISRANIAGVILSSVGVLYLIIKGNINNIAQLDNLNKGDFWAMGSAASWALYCSCLRIKDKRISGNAFVTVSSIIGALILLPFFIVSIYKNTGEFASLYTNHNMIIGLAYLIIFPSWLAYLFWSKGIAVVGATKGEIYTHLVPLFGGIFGIVFLKDTFKFYHLVSAILIVAGIFLCSKHKKSKASQDLVMLTEKN
ncbi:MAG: DMT family transporter, partial [Gammaproteobacteria bacterium]